jgi:DNA-binding CsgD family transcriptional regulator
VDPPLREGQRHRARALEVRGYVPRQVREALDRAGSDDLDTLVAIGREARACEQQDLRTLETARVEIHLALGRLRRCATSARMLERVPGELTRACGFARAMISRVHHSEWIPILPPPGYDADTDRFRAALGEEPKLPLAHMLLEAEMVRRRKGVRVEDAATDPCCHAVFIELAGAHGYVGAPVMPSGRVIGFLHADRRGQDHPTTDEDLDNLTLFADHFGLLYERAVLAEELERHADRIRAVEAELVRDVGRLAGATVSLQPSGRPAAPAFEESADDGVAPAQRVALLSTREREVLELIVAGENNRAIARELVLAEQTIKTHVSHILRKLRVTNRAEAAARYLRIREGIR